MIHEQYVMTLSCPDQPGLVAKVSGHLTDCGGNIVDAQLFDDFETARFFMRLVFSFSDGDGIARFTDGMAPLGETLNMTWSIRPRSQLTRVMLLVSKFDHCLVDLLYRWRIGELPMDVVGIASNHDRQTFSHIDLDGIPFHYLPVTPETKASQERALLGKIQSSGAELVVLARYMQILSDELSAALAGRCINIHHSFLPGFKGAKPYHQAYARGVKLIGATAHYVTADLDEGPIIEQDVERITRDDRPDDLVRKGRDIERRVLARALRLHLDTRVIVNGHKTIVFED